jgi:hypothetical protein
MGAQSIYVGVDVTKERLHVAVRPSGECFSEANDERAVSRLGTAPARERWQAPRHPALAETLHAYIAAADITEDRKSWLFRTAKRWDATTLRPCDA